MVTTSINHLLLPHITDRKYDIFLHNEQIIFNAIKGEDRFKLIGEFSHRWKCDCYCCKTLSLRLLRSPTTNISSLLWYLYLCACPYIKDYSSINMFYCLNDTDEIVFIKLKASRTQYNMNYIELIQRTR